MKTFSILFIFTGLITAMGTANADGDIYKETLQEARQLDEILKIIPAVTEKTRQDIAAHFAPKRLCFGDLWPLQQLIDKSSQDSIALVKKLGFIQDHLERLGSETNQLSRFCLSSINATQLQAALNRFDIDAAAIQKQLKTVFSEDETSQTQTDTSTNPELTQSLQERQRLDDRLTTELSHKKQEVAANAQQLESLTLIQSTLEALTEPYKYTNPPKAIVAKEEVKLCFNPLASLAFQLSSNSLAAPFAKNVKIIKDFCESKTPVKKKAAAVFFSDVIATAQNARSHLADSIAPISKHETELEAELSQLQAEKHRADENLWATERAAHLEAAWEKLRVQHPVRTYINGADQWPAWWTQEVAERIERANIHWQDSDILNQLVKYIAPPAHCTQIVPQLLKLYRDQYEHFKKTMEPFHHYQITVLEKWRASIASSPTALAPKLPGQPPLDKNDEFKLYKKGDELVACTKVHEVLRENKFGPLITLSVERQKEPYVSCSSINLSNGTNNGFDLPSSATHPETQKGNGFFHFSQSEKDFVVSFPGVNDCLNGDASKNLADLASILAQSPPNN